MDQAALMPNVLMIGMIIMVFYFLLIRPQQKKMREHREMLAAIRRGDRVVTGGGLLAQVIKVGEGDEVTVEIADDVRVKVVRSTITMVLAKPQPAGKESAAANANTGGNEQKAPGLLGKLFPRK